MNEILGSLLLEINRGLFLFIYHLLISCLLKHCMGHNCEYNNQKKKIKINILARCRREKKEVTQGYVTVSLKEQLYERHGERCDGGNLY